MQRSVRERRSKSWEEARVAGGPRGRGDGEGRMLDGVGRGMQK